MSYAKKGLLKCLDLLILLEDEYGAVFTKEDKIRLDRIRSVLAI